MPLDPRAIIARYTSAQLERVYEMADTQLCVRDFHHFVRQAWETVEPGIEFRDNWHIEAICRHMEAAARGRIPQLLINVPPGTMKSLLVCVFWPAWVWTWCPEKRFLFASYSDALTMRDSVRCRTLLLSEWYQKRWPVKLRDDQNSKGLFENSQTGWRLATSVGGKGTGLHPDFIVADDPNNAKEAESEAERQGVIDWWDGTISTRGISRGVVQIVIQQRLHTNDLTGHLLDKGTWEQICLPMRFEPGRMKPTSLGFNDPRKEDGELLWPSLFTETMVRRLEKEMGAYFGAGQLQQRPAPRGGGMFKREWWEIVPVAPRILQTVRYWDKAGTAGGDGARTAGVKMGRCEDGSYIVLDVKKDRLSAPDRERLIKQTTQLDGYNCTVWIEQEPGSGGKESAENTVRNLAGYNCQIERVTGEKVVRAEPLAAQASVRNVRLLAGPWNEEFISEAEVFPVGRLKDQVDAAGGALNKLCQPTGAFEAGAIQLTPGGHDGVDLSAYDVELTT